MQPPRRNRNGRERIREEGDHDLEALRAALAAWHGAFGTTAVTVRAALDACEKNADLRLALCGLGGRGDGDKVTSRGIGYALRKAKGRIVNDQRFEMAGRSQGCVRWRVEVSQ